MAALPYGSANVVDAVKVISCKLLTSDLRVALYMLNINTLWDEKDIVFICYLTI